jgi:hypothetical protein
MKIIDKLLRRWRVRVALNLMPAKVNSVFDIGCDDGYLLDFIADGIIRTDGCDPRLASNLKSELSNRYRGFFPSVLVDNKILGPYDAIFSLAVFEHFTSEDLTESAYCISQVLSDSGLLIVTVPHPFVDKILDLLTAVKLIDGQALEEHHAFDPSTLPDIFAKSLRLVKRGTFQFGLNNFFVFEKIK